MKKTDPGNSAFIKLGRIAKPIEEKLGLSLANDVGIYLLEATADQFAREHPDSYLSLIEEIANAIRKPDSFAYSEEADELYFYRLYPRGQSLFLLEARIAHCGHPRKWVLSRFAAHKNLDALKDLGKIYLRN